MSTRFEELHIDQLVIHPKNVRKDVGIVTDLANSITAQGIMQPLVVAPYIVEKPYGEVSKYVIIAGHRRHAAAKLANLDVLPCVIRADLDTEPKQLVAMLVENTQRTDLTPVEEATAYQTILDFGDDFTVKAVAKATGRSQSHVRKRLLLTKLNEDAKDKLEDQTLNLDQALVLVDFAEDQDATERLLEAAATGRNWSYTVTMETRRRDAPVKTEAANKDLEEAGAKYVPDATMYTGGWNRIYENDTNAITIEAHVAAGHQCSVNTWGDIEWFEKPAKTSKAKPELTEEEKEAKRRDAALTAALEIAHAVRAEHLKAVVKSPPEGAADEALYALLLDHVPAHTALYAEITGRPANPDDGHFAIKAALQDMTTEQMAVLLHLTIKSREDELLKLWGWDAGDYRHHYGARTWIESLGTVYHYELSSIEQEVLDHYVEAKAARDAEIATEDQEEEDYDDE